MKSRTIWIAVLAGALSAGALAQQQPAIPSAAPTVQAGDTRPIHIYIRAGLKSHGEGAHDYPQFIADWSKLQDALKAKIAVCTGATAASEAPYLVSLVTPARNVSIVVPQDVRYNPNMPGGPKSAYVMLLVENHAVEQEIVDTFGLTSTRIDDPFRARSAGILVGCGLPGGS